MDFILITLKKTLKIMTLHAVYREDKLLIGRIRTLLLIKLQKKEI